MNGREEPENLEAHRDAMRKHRKNNETLLQNLNGAMVVSSVKLLAMSAGVQKKGMRLTCSTAEEASLN